MQPDSQFFLKGAGLGALHAQLAPHLDGRYTEAQLLEAVPPDKHRVLQAYLDGLREAGAFAEAPTLTSPPVATGFGAVETGDAWMDEVLRAVHFDDDPGVDVWIAATATPQDVLVRLDVLFRHPRPLAGGRGFLS